MARDDKFPRQLWEICVDGTSNLKSSSFLSVKTHEILQQGRTEQIPASLI